MLQPVQSRRSFLLLLLPPFRKPKLEEPLMSTSLSTNSSMAGSAGAGPGSEKSPTRCRRLTERSPGSTFDGKEGSLSGSPIIYRRSRGGRHAGTWAATGALPSRRSGRGRRHSRALASTLSRRRTGRLGATPPPCRSRRTSLAGRRGCLGGRLRWLGRMRRRRGIAWRR